MNTRIVITACAAAVIGFALSVSSPASAQDAKACGKQWSAMTKDQKKGLKKKSYVADCVAKASPATTPMAAPAKKSTTAGQKGRQAFYARERECGKQWKAAKAAGTIPAGQKWPQYLSQCNARLKAQGM